MGRKVLARHPGVGEGLFHSFTSAGEGQLWLGWAGIGWDGIGWEAQGGLVGCFAHSCVLPLPPPSPSHLQGVLIKAETAKGEKSVLANKLFAVYEQVKAELE